MVKFLKTIYYIYNDSITIKVNYKMYVQEYLLRASGKRQTKTNINNNQYQSFLSPWITVLTTEEAVKVIYYIITQTRLKFAFNCGASSPKD